MKIKILVAVFALITLTTSSYYFLSTDKSRSSQTTAPPEEFTLDKADPTLKQGADFTNENDLDNTPLQNNNEKELPQKTKTDTSAETETKTPISPYVQSYTLKDEKYRTDVTVSLSNTTRTIVSNALPNHDTGNFPNSGNPNAIAEQNNTYSFPLYPTWTGTAQSVREPGVAVNGIKFEPETAEEVVCSSGEIYRIEAFQDFANLGFDVNNAHVQPDGTYHYHGSPTGLISSLSNGTDPIHIGFAADGYLMYYSPSNAYIPSYQLKTQKRTGTNCIYRNQTVTINNTSPDGTYVSDWQYVEGSGSLDECNGTEINGEYAYVVTDSYPYISRCLNGSFTESAPSGNPPGGTMPPPGAKPSGPPPR